MQGALVFPEGSVGIMDASATLNPEIPFTFNSGSTTVVGSSVAPILHVPTGW